MRTEPAIVRVQVICEKKRADCKKCATLIYIIIYELKTYLYSQTPPRILTLDNHYFPAVDEDEPPVHSNEVVNSVDVVVPKKYNTETQITRHVRYRLTPLKTYCAECFTFFFHTENKRPLITLSMCLWRPAKKYNTYVVKWAS